MWGIVPRPHWNCHLFQVGVKIDTSALKNYITLSHKVKANYPMIPRDVSNRNEYIFSPKASTEMFTAALCIIH